MCGEIFTHIPLLQRHKIDEHSSPNSQQLVKSKDKASGEINVKRLFCCETCGRKFKLAENLNRHKMIHNDARPFRCTHCNKSFRLSQHLKEHIRTHTGEKPYKCNICGHAFCQISNLKSHQRTHSKVKAFKCDECGKEFRRSFTLKQHKMAHQRLKEILPLEALQNNVSKSQQEIFPTPAYSVQQSPSNKNNHTSPNDVRQRDWAKSTKEGKFSPIWEAFVQSCCPPVAKSTDPEPQGTWPEMQEIAKLAQQSPNRSMTKQRPFDSVYDVTNDDSPPSKVKRETSFFVEQIIGRRDSTGSDKAEVTSSDDSTAGSDVTEPQTENWNRYLEWESPRSNKQPKCDVTQWPMGAWGHVIPLVEWKPVITGWRSLVDGRVYSAYRGFAM